MQTLEGNISEIYYFRKRVQQMKYSRRGLISSKVPVTLSRSLDKMTKTNWLSTILLILIHTSNR